MYSFDFYFCRWSFGVLLSEIFTRGNIELKFMRFCRRFFLYTMHCRCFCYIPCLIKQCIMFIQTNLMSFSMQPQTPSTDIGGVLMKVFFRHTYNSMVFWFFQAVHLTHERMEEKLQTYFRIYTGCLNHNTSMKNCISLL